MNCQVCGNEIKSTWKYCRFCGTKLEVLPKLEDTPTKNEEELIEDAVKDEPKQKEEIEFDKDLYYRILATRSRRKRLAERKEELLEEVNSLLEQVKSGLVKPDYAKPKISELKDQVKEITEEEKKFSSLPEELPYEVLLDEIDAAKEKFNRLLEIKKSESISKDTLQEAKKQYLENIQLLEGQKSTVVGHMRKWLHELKEKQNKLRKERETLYLKKELEELTKEEYERRNKELVEKLSELDQVIRLVQILIEA